MDLLNLDELTELKREVTIRGINYAVVERSVGVMLDSIRVAKMAAVKGKSKQTEDAFFENMIGTIQTIIPDCPLEIVRGLTMNQMVALFDFCNRDPNVMAEEALAAEGAVEKDGVVVSEGAGKP